MDSILAMARKFVKDDELGEATEEQGIDVLKGLCTHLDKITATSGRDLATIADVYTCMGQLLANRLMAEQGKKSQNSIASIEIGEFTL